MKKIIVLFIAILSAAIIFTGCTPIEEYIHQPKLKYDTIYPATPQEYNLTMNKKIVPVLNMLEGHMAKAGDIVDGDYPIEQEINAVKDSVDYCNNTYEECLRVYPPDSCSERHSDILKQLKKAINSLEVYKETLESGQNMTSTDQENITKSAKIMESEFTSLKNMFNII